MLATVTVTKIEAPNHMKRRRCRCAAMEVTCHRPPRWLPPPTSAVTVLLDPRLDVLLDVLLDVRVQ